MSRLESVDTGSNGSAVGASVHQLRVTIGRREVLKGIDLALGPAIVSLVGPNGAGKTTLLRTLATLLRPTSGRVEVAGSDLSTRTGRAAARHHLGFLPQDPQFPLRYTVREALTYACWLHKVASPQRAVATALAELDLTAVADTQLGALSGGTRRRVFIGQATAHTPSVLLLDEPTVGIDAEHRVELRRLITRLANHRLVAVTTHMTEDIELMADRVVVLHDGQVRFDGSPAELAALGSREAGDVDERPIERALRIKAGLT